MSIDLLESDISAESECDHLAGRLRDICMGISGLPRVTENMYRALPQFGSLPPLPERPARRVNARRKPADQKIRGLGDVVAAITKATGIDRLVKAVTGKKGCGCGKRRAALNRLMPFGSAGE
jgi:hypothetical protein